VVGVAHRLAMSGRWAGRGVARGAASARDRAVEPLARSVLPHPRDGTGASIVLVSRAVRVPIVC